MDGKKRNVEGQRKRDDRCMSKDGQCMDEGELDDRRRRTGKDGYKWRDVVSETSKGVGTGCARKKGTSLITGVWIRTGSGDMERAG